MTIRRTQCSQTLSVSDFHGSEGTRESAGKGTLFAQFTSLRSSWSHMKQLARVVMEALLFMHRPGQLGIMRLRDLFEKENGCGNGLARNFV